MTDDLHRAPPAGIIRPAEADTTTEALTVANCCVCGRIIDKREAKDGGDDFGCEHADGRWTCGSECSEAAFPPPEWLKAGLVEVRDEALDALLAELSRHMIPNGLHSRAVGAITTLRQQRDTFAANLRDAEEEADRLRAENAKLWADLTTAKTGIDTLHQAWEHESVVSRKRLARAERAEAERDAAQGAWDKFLNDNPSTPWAKLRSAEAEVARLEHELAVAEKMASDANDSFSEQHDAHNDALDEVADLRARLAAAEALGEYLAHKVTCDAAHPLMLDAPCTCGLDEALAVHRARLSEKGGE